jgi:hypothetical protein
LAAARLTSLPKGVPCVLRSDTVEQGTTSTIALDGGWDLGQRDRAVQRVLEICGLIEILPFAPEAGSVPSHIPRPTEEPGASSLHPQRRRRSLAEATGGASPGGPKMTRGWCRPPRAG